MKQTTLLLALGLTLPFALAGTVSANYYQVKPLRLTIKPVTNAQTKITGTVTTGATVQFYQDGSLKAKVTANKSGHYTIPLSYSLSHIGSYKITATKYSYKPITKTFKVSMYPYTAQIKPLQTQIDNLQQQLNTVQAQLNSMQGTADGLNNPDTSSSTYQKALSDSGSNPQAYQANYLALQQQAINLQNQIDQLQTQIQQYKNLSNQ